MRRRWHLLRAAWWGVLASQVDHVIRLSSLRRGPLLGAAALALLLAPLALVLHHGQAVSRGPGARMNCANSNSVAMGAPIPLANGPVRVMTTPYHGAAAPMMDLTLYCSGRQYDGSFGKRHHTHFAGDTSPLSLTLAYVRYAHALSAAHGMNVPAANY
ncbi:MAG: hypothetical protein ACRDGS_12145 [Chloroflexota bacterium]